MKKFTLLFTLALSLRAEDKPAPTVEQLQAQLAAKDQQIAQQAKDIESIGKLLGWYKPQLLQCLDAQILNQAAPQRAQPPPRPASAKPEAKP